MNSALRKLCDPVASESVITDCITALPSKEEQLLTFLHRNSVFLAFSHNLRRSECGMARLRQLPGVVHRSRRVSDRHDRMRSALAKIDQLWGEDTPIVLLKGLPIARLYPDTCRDIGDVDLYVRDVRTARRLLERIPRDDFVMQGIEIYERCSMGTRGEVIVRDRKLNVVVSVTFGAIPVVGPSALFLDVVEKSTPGRDGLGRFTQPSAEHALIILAAGVLRHGYFKLRDLLDARFILEEYDTTLDVECIHDISREAKLDSVVEALFRSVRWAGEIPFGALHSATSTAVGFDATVARARLSAGHRFTTPLSTVFVTSHLWRAAGAPLGLWYGIVLLATSIRRQRRGKVFSTTLRSRFAPGRPQTRLECDSLGRAIYSLRECEG